MLELLTSKTLVADGAIGTELLKRSNEKFPEILNFTNPQLVESLHIDYTNAGADIITTNSFGANPARLKSTKINIYELNKTSAQLARKVNLSNKLIFGSVGPSGLKPGDEEFKKLADYYFEQIRGLADGGVNAILIETMIFIEEMKIVCEVARNVTKLPLALSMSFHKTKNGFKTYAGVDLKIAVKEMLKLGAEIIGANCGNGFAEMVDIAKNFKSITKEIPVLVKPSAGTPRKINNDLIYPDTPETIPEFVRKLVDIGINIIGGCCGTTPEHIKVIRKIVDETAQK
ncbi:homocysteine S-methyltransferase family protein [Candidatus Kryptobacter tengchongensis]|uniref:5-methyltetrahydrofolate--homocysteine methyltransferase n=1 Tax=Kryptobacter tengchongensis TaxID=1643429 RepID=A0A656CXA4_KRYT1|nr:homocysteine S-methyltransferase family protein [Candidatus Kryptobacter tengchongensis]CUS78655.1 5-methyltetrahydrofolate--homocysteine methyltransferase [Candidatus Kryptobacter tengchongensis]CUT03878.1 5-methyltetrahydrofolate--homocysteine methyltransferase [Candidatus Kryptobacter tengchongensis]